jgi:large-conductance mechanosensitive channel
MNEITEQVVDLLTRIEAGLIDVAPEALDLAVNVVRFDAIGELIVGVITLIIGAVAVFWGIKLLNQYKGSIDKYGFSEEDHKQFFGMVLLFISSIPVILFMVSWFNIWNWVALFNPEFALAKQILGMF